jgi:hypothetical protein
MEGGDPTAATKVQKADREKIRRDRLNDSFHELGTTLGKSTLQYVTLASNRHSWWSSPLLRLGLFELFLG